MSRQLDTIKLNHWLNVRKMALDVFNNLLVKRTNHRIELDNLENIDDYTVNEIAKILDVPKDYIIYNEEVPPYIFNSKEQNGNDMSEGVKKSNKSRSARPFNRVNDEEWLNEKNKKGDNKFRNAHWVGNYRKNLGYKAEQKFVQKQGKQFAHEKNKEKKRRVYRGGKIETNAVNSRVLFDSSSDEDEVL